MNSRNVRLTFVAKLATAGGLFLLAACQTGPADSRGRTMQLAEWKEIDVAAVDLNVPLLITPKVTKAEYQNRDNQVNHHRLRLDGGKGMIFTQRYPDAWYSDATQKEMGGIERFKATVVKVLDGDNVGYGNIQEIKHRSRKAVGFATLVDVKDVAKGKCLFAEGAYRLKPRTYYDNDEGNVDTILTMIYCDPKVAFSDFSRALEDVEIVTDRPAFTAALAAK